MATPKPDHWSAEKYQNAAGFVPQLAIKVLEYLSPQPSERIIDIGCGDGQITILIAQSVTSSGRVLGLDASPSFVAFAKQNRSLPQVSYELQDCTRLRACAHVGEAQWDKIFSNAAMHWILRDSATRESFFACVHRALRSGGRFVFETGGKGNVAELHAAFTAALATVGNLSLQEAREASPWFFPSETWMRVALNEAGFDVLVCESEYRPTKMTEVRADGTGGLEGWVRLMGASFLAAVEESRREDILKSVCEWVESVVAREEDGSRWIGYVRLRVVARKRKIDE